MRGPHGLGVPNLGLVGSRDKRVPDLGGKAVCDARGRCDKPVAGGVRDAATAGQRGAVRERYGIRRRVGQIAVQRER